MAKTDTVRIYDSDYSFVRWISPSERDEKLISGLYEKHFELRGDGRTRYVGIRRISGRPARSSKRQSSASITATESLANVCITGKRREDLGTPANAGQVRAAKAKIAAWPLVGDDKAPRAGVQRAGSN